MEKVRHLRIKIIFIVGTVLLLSLSVYSYLRINSLMKSATMVNHTNVVKLELESLFSELKDAESSQRGYLLTGHEAFLNQYRQTLINVERRTKRLDSLTDDNYSQRVNTNALKVLLDKRIRFMNGIVRDHQGKIDTQRWLKGRTLMDNLRKQVDKMMAEEDLLLRIRTKSLTKESSITPLLTIFLIICSILVLIMSYYGINMELKISNALKADLEEHKLNLQEANDSLQQSNQEIALSRYNKRFLTEFSERFSSYKIQTEFFNSVVQYIADLMHIDYVMVGKLETEGELQVIHTIAVVAFGELAGNFSYALTDGPCEQVIAGEMVSFANGTRKVFPKSKMLKQFKVDGYIGNPLFDTDGSVIGILSVMHRHPIADTETLGSVLKVVTKRAEIELERIKNEEILEKKNAALEETNESLAKMNKELESFTYISSHDLQEPLRKIQTFITRIIEVESEKLSENGKGYLARTRDAANRMQNLIRDLLAYSRLNIEIFPTEEANLRDIVAEVKTDLDEEIHRKEAVVEVKGHAHVTIIRSQFHQLLTNLISNSIKFTPKEVVPHIIVQNTVVEGKKVPFEHADKNQHYCKITIADNGIGFENEYKDRIFEVFQRLHSTSEFPGTGIGLAIVKKITENHGGFVSADSKPGKGAVFTIYIPA